MDKGARRMSKLEYSYGRWHLLSNKGKMLKYKAYEVEDDGGYIVCTENEKGYIDVIFKHCLTMDEVWKWIKEQREKEKE